MKVRVDPAISQGHTLCAFNAPDLFVLSEEDGHMSAVSEDVPKARPTKVVDGDAAQVGGVAQRPAWAVRPWHEDDFVIRHPVSDAEVLGWTVSCSPVASFRL